MMLYSHELEIILWVGSAKMWVINIVIKVFKMYIKIHNISEETEATNLFFYKIKPLSETPIILIY